MLILILTLNVIKPNSTKTIEDLLKTWLPCNQVIWSDYITTREKWEKACQNFISDWKSAKLVEIIFHISVTIL